MGTECTHLAQLTNVMVHEQLASSICSKFVDIPSAVSQSLWMVKKMVQKGEGILHEDAQMLAKSHEQQKQLCKHPECFKPFRVLKPYVASCYASTLCGALTTKTPYNTCKPHIEKLYNSEMNFTQYKESCAKEPGTETFCSEIFRNLMIDHYDCFNQMHNPMYGCSQKCSQIWRMTQSKFPVCASTLAQQIVRQQADVVSVVHMLDPTSASSPNRLFIRSAHEICADISDNVITM